ncbi:GPI-anchored protein LORELEI-like [Quillaja saponaria]|uniref:GPI-anchored protein LORELEI-like n=1 Tax=Quillaja saponaria TaxID=32244 RepID=A0AAD7QHC5_QUISA|nr:GPI-anchored protein LORELEI-like [Quillaja saponaria]
MGSIRFFYHVPCFFFFISMATASTFISNEVFDSPGSTGRSLLQVKKACAVDFENKNYTVLTSQCKGPQYPPKVCCEAFKEFACPVVDEINDASSDCAATMFSYINIYGKYPPGLFANQCKEGKEGLDCSQINAANETAKSDAGQIAASRSTLLMTTAGFLVFLFHWF